MVTDLDDPSWRSLLATKNTLRPYDTRDGINSAVEDINRHDMSTVRIRVFLPNPKIDVLPWVTTMCDPSAVINGIETSDVLVMEHLGEKMNHGEFFWRRTGGKVVVVGVESIADGKLEIGGLTRPNAVRFSQTCDDNSVPLRTTHSRALLPGSFMEMEPRTFT